MVMVRTGGSRCPYGSFRVGADVFPGKAVVLRSHRIHRCLHHVAYMSSQIADSHTHTHTHTFRPHAALCSASAVSSVVRPAAVRCLRLSLLSPALPVYLSRYICNGQSSMGRRDV